MQSQTLKGLLTVCPDATDLPTDEMLDAGKEAVKKGLFGGYTDGEIAELVWNAMLGALRGGSHVR